MRWTLPWAGTLLALALPLSAATAQDKGKVASSEKEAAAKLVAAGALTGRVVNFDEEKKTLTLELTLVYQVPNAGAINNIANIRAQMATARDLNTMRNLQVQLVQQQAKMYDVKNEKHNVDVEVSDDAKIRTKDPPPLFDEKGNPRKPTAKELRDLRGNDLRLPGYAADFDGIKPDSMVEVHLAKPKATPKPRATKDKDADKDTLLENQPVATMIVILTQPADK